MRTGRAGGARPLVRESEIRERLEAELRKRLEDLTVDALGFVRDDRRRTNAAVDSLLTAGLSEQWYQHTRIELNVTSDHDGPAYVTSVETDRHPAAAASRFLVHEASQELLESALVHDDAELLAEAIADGDAFRGSIVDVADEGEGRLVPIWTVETPFAIQTRLRPGSEVCVVGCPRRTARVRSLDNTPSGGYRFELEITNLKKAISGAEGRDAIPPVDQRWKGEKIGFVQASGDGIARSKSFKVWTAKSGPGSWLTHSRPGGPRAAVAEDDVDDVAAVERAQ